MVIFDKGDAAREIVTCAAQRPVDSCAMAWSRLQHRVTSSRDQPVHPRGSLPAGPATSSPAAARPPVLSNLLLVSDKSGRRAARAAVAEYHRAQLDELVARVGEAVDRYRAGELDGFDVDQVLFQYSRAAKELWKFCNHLQVEVAAAMIREQPPHDWWERGAPKGR